MKNMKMIHQESVLSAVCMIILLLVCFVILTGIIQCIGEIMGQVVQNKPYAFAP